MTRRRKKRGSERVAEEVSAAVAVREWRERCPASSRSQPPLLFCRGVCNKMSARFWSRDEAVKLTCRPSTRSQRQLGRPSTLEQPGWRLQRPARHTPAAQGTLDSHPRVPCRPFGAVSLGVRPPRRGGRRLKSVDARRQTQHPSLNRMQESLGQGERL